MKVLSAFISIILFSIPLYAQKKGSESINVHDLKMHMQFLASDELEGRDTGEPGLQVAARYLAVQAERLGLQAADADGDYMQPYIIEEKAYDLENSHVAITVGDTLVTINSDPFYILPAPFGDQTIIEGKVVFVGSTRKNMPTTILKM